MLTAVTEVAADGETPAALLADSAAHYIAANDAACALTGRSREELLSLSVWDLTPQIAVAEGREAWARFVESGNLSGAYVLKTPSGRRDPGSLRLVRQHPARLPSLSPAVSSAGAGRRRRAPITHPF